MTRRVGAALFDGYDHVCVFATHRVFEILKPVVALYAVLVVDIKAGRARADEGGHDERMDEGHVPAPLAVELDEQVAMTGVATCQDETSTSAPAGDVSTHLVKWDGKRALLTSRHEEAIPVSQPLLAKIAEALGPLPPCVLDGEWMGRRDGQPKSLWLFGVRAIRGEWLRSLPLRRYLH